MSVLFGCVRKTGQCEANRKMAWSLVMMRFARLAIQKGVFVKKKRAKMGFDIIN